MGSVVKLAQSVGSLDGDPAGRRPPAEQRGDAPGHLSLSRVFNALGSSAANSP